jgi:hypothetical protein
LGHADGVTGRLVRALHVATAGVLLAGTLAAVSACGQNSGCVHTAISVQPAHLRSQTAPLTLHATLTSDGTPLPSFRLSFFLVLTGPTTLVGKSGQTLDLLGYGFTDPKGVASYTIPDGVSGVILPGEHVVGYQVGLTTANPINGKQYCDVHASADLR